MTVAILGSSGGWHARRLSDALAARGHAHRLVPVTRLVGRVDGGVAVRGGEHGLDDCDAVLVRGIPRGSLEQVIFRVDALHALEACGAACAPISISWTPKPSLTGDGSSPAGGRPRAAKLAASRP